MGLTVSSKGNDFEQIPEGTYLGRSYILADVGTQPGYEGGKPAPKVAIVWELKEAMSDGRPYVISKTYRQSLNEKATLRKDLEAWRGRAFTPEELEGFNLVNILGKSCLINIVHKKKQNGEICASISSIMALPKGMEFLDPYHLPVYFDLDNFTQEEFENLPNWIKNMILGSPEYKALHTGVPSEPSVDNDFSVTEDIPF